MCWHTWSLLICWRRESYSSQSTGVATLCRDTSFGWGVNSWAAAPPGFTISAQHDRSMVHSLSLNACIPIADVQLQGRLECQSCCRCFSTASTANIGDVRGTCNLACIMVAWGTALTERHLACASGKTCGASVPCSTARCWERHTRGSC